MPDRVLLADAADPGTYFAVKGNAGRVMTCAACGQRREASDPQPVELTTDRPICRSCCGQLAPDLAGQLWPPVPVARAWVEPWQQKARRW